MCVRISGTKCSRSGFTSCQQCMAVNLAWEQGPKDLFPRQADPDGKIKQHPCLFIFTRSQLPSWSQFEIIVVVEYLVIVDSEARSVEVFWKKYRDDVNFYVLITKEYFVQHGLVSRILFFDRFEFLLPVMHPLCCGQSTSSESSPEHSYTMPSTPPRHSLLLSMGPGPQKTEHLRDSHSLHTPETMAE